MLKSSYQSMLIAASSARALLEPISGVGIMLSVGLGDGGRYWPSAGMAGAISAGSRGNCVVVVGMVTSASRRSRAVRSSKERKKRSRTQFSRSHDFCNSFSPRRHNLALCSASFLAVPVTRPKWMVCIHRAEKVCVILTLLVQAREDICVTYRCNDPCCTRFSESISSNIRVLRVAASSAIFPSGLLA